MKRFKQFALALSLLTCVLNTTAQDTQRYTAPTNTVQLGFNHGSYRQEGYPNLKSDFGFSFTTYHSYWLFKPGNHRCQLGIDVGWLDINYFNYKVNTRTLDGLLIHNTFHQGDIGIQGGLGINFNITRDIRLHVRVCYNPSFSGIMQSSKLHGAFGNYALAGLQLTWKRIGLGVDARFGAAKYKKISLFEDDEDYDHGEDLGLTTPGVAQSDRHIKTNLVSLRSCIVFNF